MATALYRRYRPEAFSEMIGQAHVTEPLMTALRAGRIGHAYLFSGPRGCGKTTSARILARCLNCAEGPTDTPCGTCPSCVELSREGGGSLDVVEIDAASHGGVDDARELRERAVFAPARDRYKIFIIDEAHMVTSGGFNALLKIVEEPPPHVKFVFATTEPDKVIGTIRSRTHHYPFRLIAPGTLIDYVQQLAGSEGIEVEPGVLPLVVRAGGGSVRDTLSILDQLIAGSEDGRVGLDRATGLLGFTSTELLDEVIAAFGAGDSAAAFAATDRVVQTGQDPRRFVEDLLERLRDLIVIGATSVDGAAAVLRGVPEDQLQRMFAQAQLFAPGRLSRIADTVSAALDKMTGATAPRLHLELMIARALVEQARSEHGQGQGRQAPPARPQAEGSAPASQPADSQQPAPQQPASRPSAPRSPEPQPSAPATPAARSQADPPSAAAAAAAPGGPTGEEPAVDVTATLRSARDFLNSDSAGAGRPGGRSHEAEKAAPAPADDAPTADAASTDAAAATSTVEPVGLGELREVWPELLEELLESDREAWNAVKNVQPLAFEGEVLTIGLASRSDLDAFKAAGAGPLREAIEAALGVTVTYVPRPLPAGSTAAPREPQSRDAEPSPATEPGGEIGREEVDRDKADRDEADTDEAHKADGDEAGGEALRDETPAPAWADLGAGASVPDEPRDDGAEEPEYQPAERPSADRGPVERDSAEHDSAECDSAHDPAEDSEAGEADEGDAPSAQQAAADDARAAPAEPAAPSLPEPIVGRYGEAVVREMLGARFVEERPLPQGEA